MNSVVWSRPPVRGSAVELLHHLAPAVHRALQVIAGRSLDAVGLQADRPTVADLLDQREEAFDVVVSLVEGDDGIALQAVDRDTEQMRKDLLQQLFERFGRLDPFPV